MQLPSLNRYGRGDNAAAVTVGNLTIWFSYATPVAFQVAGGPRYVSENLWSTTTGSHLNSIDGGAKAARLKRGEFEDRLSEAIDGEPVGA